MQRLRNIARKTLVNVVNEINVLHAAKHESILKVDSIIFNGFGQVCPKYPRKIAIFL